MNHTHARTHARSLARTASGGAFSLDAPTLARTANSGAFQPKIRVSYELTDSPRPRRNANSDVVQKNEGPLHHQPFKLELAPSAAAHSSAFKVHPI